VGACGASQAQSIEAEDALEVGEQHLHLLALAVREGVGLGLDDGVRQVAGPLEDGARHFARRRVRAALGLESAGLAVLLVGAVEQRRAVGSGPRRWHGIFAWGGSPRRGPPSRVPPLGAQHINRRFLA
jgi:hypothetical protein